LLSPNIYSIRSCSRQQCCPICRRGAAPSIRVERLPNPSSLFGDRSYDRRFRHGRTPPSAQSSRISGHSAELHTVPLEFLGALQSDYSTTVIYLAAIGLPQCDRPSDPQPRTAVRDHNTHTAKHVPGITNLSRIRHHILDAQPASLSHGVSRPPDRPLIDRFASLHYRQLPR